MLGEDSSGEDEHSKDRRGRSRRNSRTPGLRDLDSDSLSEDWKVQDSDGLDKAEWSEEECSIKDSNSMFPWPLMITTFTIGRLWSAAHKEGSEGGDEVLQEAGRC